MIHFTNANKIHIRAGCKIYSQ